MKQLLLTSALFVSSLVFSQTKADDIIGTYMTDKNEGMVEITKKTASISGSLPGPKHRASSTRIIRTRRNVLKNWPAKRS